MTPQMQLPQSSEMPISDTAYALQVSNLAKEYRLYDSPRDRLKALLTGKDYHRSHWALQGLSFALRKGQCLGVVGDNGAGKSTLLKILAGTVSPTSGHVRTSGRVTAILELGAGFHPEFSGRENIYFAGALIGLDRPSLEALEADIAAFSELGLALDRPVKTYSSGMVVRLAFALVTAVEPEVLIVDEALAVGDQHFQKKCIERIELFRQRGCTILFCSHSLYHIRHLCDESIWLKQGKVAAFGATEQVLSAYETHVRRLQQADPDQPSISTALDTLQSQECPTQSTPHHLPSADVRAQLLQVEIANLSNDETPLLQSADLTVNIQAFCTDTSAPSIGVMLEQRHGVGITSLASHAEKIQPRQILSLIHI